VTLIQNGRRVAIAEEIGDSRARMEEAFASAELATWAAAADDGSSTDSGRSRGRDRAARSDPKRSLASVGDFGR